MVLIKGFNCIMTITPSSTENQVIAATPPSSPPSSGRMQVLSSPDSPILREISNLAFLSLESPCDYHKPSFVDKNTKSDGDPNSKLKKLEKDLKRGKPYHSLVLGSAERDPKRIRDEKIKPDKNGTFRIKSNSSDAMREWRMHEPKPNGSARLFPVKGPNILPLEGAQMGDLIDSHRKENSSITFEEHVNNSTEKVSKVSPRILFKNKE